MRFWRRRAGPDPEAFFRELRSSYGSSYSKVDRYREFRRVFLETDEGKRVLYEILSWCGMFRPSTTNFDTNETFFNEGERNVALKLMHVIATERHARPTSTKES